MVVTAGAAYGQTQKRLSEDIDAIGQAVGEVLADVNRRVNLLAQQPEAGAEDRFIEAFSRVLPGRFQQVTRDALGHEAVVRHVGNEGRGIT